MINWLNLLFIIVKLCFRLTETEFWLRFEHVLFGCAASSHLETRTRGNSFDSYFTQCWTTWFIAFPRTLAFTERVSTFQGWYWTNRYRHKTSFLFRCVRCPCIYWNKRRFIIIYWFPYVRLGTCLLEISFCFVFALEHHLNNVIKKFEFTYFKWHRRHHNCLFNQIGSHFWSKVGIIDQISSLV